MNPRVNYKRCLSRFLGEQYKNNLPTEDMELFCLLTGVNRAKTLCQAVYSTIKVPIMCENLLRYEEKRRLALYDECHVLIKGYIYQVKNLGDKSYFNWYSEMHQIYESNKEFYEEKCKKEANKIMLAVYSHLMRNL